MTECTEQIELFSIGRRKITIGSDTSLMSSDSGALLLRQIDRKLRLCERLGGVLPESRQASKVLHTQTELVRQRVFGIACGYEDCNDADRLRFDPVLQLAVGRAPGSPQAALASQPTLSRFENSVGVAELIAVSYELIELFVERLASQRRRSLITLDFDGTDDATHGQQQLTFFHGLFDQHMYYPLLVFDQEGWPVAAVLRPGNAGAAKGTLSVLRRLVRRIRQVRPRIRIRFRADGGFAIPEIYDWCERNGVEYLIGQPSRAEWKQRIEPLMRRARAEQDARGGTVRLFGEFRRRARSWSRERRVVVKAEVLAGGDNARFVLTNIDSFTPEQAYTTYVGRGQMENHIKDLKNALFADRLSCSTFVANQFRLVLHVAAYILMHVLREQWAKLTKQRIQLDTVRLWLVKIGARVTVSARRVWIQMSASHPHLMSWKRLATALSNGPPI